METLKIQIPNGFEIDTFNKETGEIKFKPKPKNVLERIKTVADVLADNNIKGEDFDKQNVGLTKDEVAYRIIKLLVKSLNEGWVPDWDNGKYDKYFPWFYLDGSSSGFRYGDCDSWHSSSIVGSRLCFKSSELSKYAGTQFVSVYKDFMVIE